MKYKEHGIRCAVSRHEMRNASSEQEMKDRVVHEMANKFAYDVLTHYSDQIMCHRDMMRCEDVYELRLMVAAKDTTVDIYDRWNNKMLEHMLNYSTSPFNGLLPDVDSLYGQKVKPFAGFDLDIPSKMAYTNIVVAFEYGIGASTMLERAIAALKADGFEALADGLQSEAWGITDRKDMLNIVANFVNIDSK